MGNEYHNEKAAGKARACRLHKVGGMLDDKGNNLAACARAGAMPIHLFHSWSREQEWAPALEFMQSCYILFPKVFASEIRSGFGTYEFHKPCRSLDEVGRYLTEQVTSLKWECKCAVMLTAAGRNAFPGTSLMSDVFMASPSNNNKVWRFAGGPRVWGVAATHDVTPARDDPENPWAGLS